MPIRIFETDPEAKPAPRATFDDGTIGKLHSGRQVNGRPVAIPNWRFTTGDHNVAAALAELFGVSVVDTESEAENHLEIQTDVDSFEVILAGVDAIEDDMKLWINKQLVHHCDGVEFLSPDEKRGTPCGCPRFFKERKEAAKTFQGPSPSIKVIFRLAEDPELGTFAYQTSSWTMAEVLHEYAEALSQVDGEAIADMHLELVEYTTKAGRAVSFRKPTLKRIRSYNAAIAETA